MIHESSDSTEGVLIASREEVQAWAWNEVQLADSIANLRRDTIAGLPVQALVDPEIFGRIYWDHPASWRLLAKHDQSVLGCWHFMSLQPESFERAMQGKLNAVDIRSDIVRSLDEPGFHDVYVLTYVVRPEWRLTAATLKLARSMFDVLLEMAQRGVFVRNLGANFVTDEGRGIGRALDMTLLCDHAVFGTVYHAHFPEMLQRLAFQDRRGMFVQQLRELYAREA